MQWLNKTCLVNVHVGDHHKQLLYYVAKLNMYSVVLKNEWLQTYNSIID